MEMEGEKQKEIKGERERERERERESEAHTERIDKRWREERGRNIRERGQRARRARRERGREREKERGKRENCLSLLVHPAPHQYTSQALPSSSCSTTTTFPEPLSSATVQRAPSLQHRPCSANLESPVHAAQGRLLLLSGVMGVLGLLLKLRKTNPRDRSPVGPYLVRS